MEHRAQVAAFERGEEEREKAFAALMARDRMAPMIFRGQSTQASTWCEAVQEQIGFQGIEFEVFVPQGEDDGGGCGCGHGGCGSH